MQFDPSSGELKNSRTKKSSQRSRGQNHAVAYTKINLSIAPGLLELVDEAAEKDFTTRSDIIRTALLWYLRPIGSEARGYQDEQEALFDLLRRRKARASTHAERQQLKKLLESEPEDLL